MRNYKITTIVFNSKQQEIEAAPECQGDKSYTLLATAYQSLSRWHQHRTFLLEYEELATDNERL